MSYKLVSYINNSWEQWHIGCCSETNEPWNDRKILQTRCDQSWVMLQ